ncbi:hypothetical protein ACFWUQ_02875 [Streptomyces sp. NPDC058662]|uniref:hypothetical protein n=1 Tax=Streptomyces sp. NPDC058662 TaxID=3346583 RepID=UPI00365968AD
MKLTRFLCAAALAAGIAGSLVAGAASDGDSASLSTSAQNPAACDTLRPGDTEWNNPATHCPPVL